MAAAATPRIIVVGGGLAGLAAAIALPAPNVAPPNSTNPQQPGRVQQQ